MYAKLTVNVCSFQQKTGASFMKNYSKTDEETSVHDVLLILGDLNAKVGTHNEGKESTMGKHGCGMINNNGSICKTFAKKTSLL